jgi:UDP-N-acetylglucosamine acyltransferase
MTNFFAYYPSSSDNRIDPTAIIGPGVELGTGNVIGPYSVIVGKTRIGDNNWIGPHVSIGTPAEWRGHPLPVGWDGEIGDGRVEIGDGNVVREFATINAGVEQATRLGNDCYLMARSHVGHDATLQDGVTLSTAAQLGGFTTVWQWANLGLGSQVHQWGQIGPGAMVGMGAVVLHPVEAFMTVVGVPAAQIGINRVGLERLGVPKDVFADWERSGIQLDSLPSNVREVLARWQKVTARR